GAGIALARALLRAAPGIVPAGLDPAAGGLLLLTPVAIGLCGGYGLGTRRAEVGRILAGVALSALLVWVYARLMAGPPVTPDAALLAAYASFSALLAIAGRLALDRAIAFAYARRAGQRRVLVVGSPGKAALVERFLASQGACNLRVVGRLSPADRPDDGALGSVAEVESALRETGARGVVLASSLPPEALETVVRRCVDAGAVVSIVPPLLPRLESHFAVRPTRPGALLEVYPRGVRVPRFAIKRAMDVGLSLIALVVLAPLMLLIAAAIKLDSRGPVL